MELSRFAEDQRDDTDRRAVSWQTVFYGFALSRRREHRRVVDDEIVFMDWHHPWLFFLATGTMLLSCADAFLTLRLIDLGMVEINPVMNAVMAHGTFLFTSTKLAMTGFGILVIVFLAKAKFLNRYRIGAFLTLLFSSYACLVCYELVNLFNLL